MSVSPIWSIAWTPLCVQGCMDTIIHCYPTPVVHCLLFSILPPVVYHHFHPIITSHLLLEAFSDFFLNGISPGQSTPRCGTTLIYCSVWVCVCVSFYVCLCGHVHICFHVCTMCFFPQMECVCKSTNLVLLLHYRNNICFFLCEKGTYVHFVHAAECVIGEPDKQSCCISIFHVYLC